MIDTPKVSEVAQAFLDDCSKLGMISDGEKWFVNKKWATKFHAHLDALLLAHEDEDPWAAYYIANIYSMGCLYVSEKAAIANYSADMTFATEWWIKAAKGGVPTALDSVLSVGVGKEADHIRKIYQDNKDKFSNDSAPSEGWKQDMILLCQLSFPE